MASSTTSTNSSSIQVPTKRQKAWKWTKTGAKWSTVAGNAYAQYNHHEKRYKQEKKKHAEQGDNEYGLWDYMKENKASIAASGLSTLLGGGAMIGGNTKLGVATMALSPAGVAAAEAATSKGDKKENPTTKRENQQVKTNATAKEATEQKGTQPIVNSTNTNQEATKVNKTPTPEAPAKAPTPKATPTTRVSNQTGEMYTVNSKIPARTYWREATNDRIEVMRNTADFKRSLQDYANTNLSQAEKERRATADVIEWNRRKQRSNKE